MALRTRHTTIFLLLGAIAPQYANAQDTVQGTIQEKNQSISQEIVQENKEVEHIIVTASRMEKPANSIPNTVTIIDSELLGFQVAIDDSLAGILEKTVPGFSPSSQKMTGSAETLRGKNPLYMIDGISQHNSLRDGLRDGFTIDSDFLDHIEVVQGANAIQGIGATGGVVNLVTKQASGNGDWNNEIKTRFTTSDELESDSFGYKVTYIGDIKLETFDFVGGVAVHERGIFYDANGDRVGFRTAQGELQDSGSTDLFIKTGYNIDDKQRLQLMVNTYELENNGSLIPVTGDREQGIYATTVDGDSSESVGEPAKNEVTTASLDYSHKAFYGGKLVSQIYYQDYSALYEGSVSSRWALTPGGDGVMDQSEIESDKYGIKLSYEMSNVAGFEGSRALLGYDYSVDNTSQTLAQTNRVWVPEMSLITSSPFMQLEYEFFNSWLISAGARYESADLDVDDFVTLPTYNNTQVAGGKPSYTETLVNVGLVYELNDAITLYASYSEGFDMPDVGRVLRALDSPGLDVDTLVDVEPVITDNTEVGMNFEMGNWGGQVSLYQSQTDLGSRLAADESGVYEVLREKQESWGYDVVINYYLNSNWTLGANYSKINGEYDSDGDGEVDTDLNNASQAPARLNAFAVGELNNIKGKLQVSHLFDRTQHGIAAYTDNRQEFEGYTIVDLSLHYQADFGLFGIGIENLLNEDYETLYSQTQNLDDRYFSGRGRTISLSYSNKF
ncbi:TonB-dependent receptor [Shewanella phaeophyticola]|uniref:TonB-dependent receptor n=1 Tax=Shewanella phaeophyticola TaxID=2978345 RepID=A0ABT2P5I2_9GAMM|nr:TonB-dependent receptor [Shewanella sp. KJ10-1]MCT8987879.1 TonB-dependent receptor [Shewanella sp. KJ10-1]